MKNDHLFELETRKGTSLKFEEPRKGVGCSDGWMDGCIQPRQEEDSYP